MIVTIPLIITTIFVTVFVQTTLSMLIKWFRLRNLPGPLPLPLIGNMYIKDFRVKTAKFLSEMTRNHGGIFLVWGVRNQPIVTVTDPKLAREVFINERLYKKGPGYEKIFAQAFGHGLVTSAGEKHKKDRALFNKYFIRKNINEGIPIFIEETKRGIEELKKAGDGTVHDMSKVFLSATLRMFTRYAMDFSVIDDLPGGADSEILKNAVKTCGPASNAVGFSVYFMLPTSRIFNPLMNTIARFRNVYDQFSDVVINKRLEERKKGNDRDDPLKAMLDNNMTMQEMKDHIRTMFGAGHDTTGYFETYTAQLLARHPEVQQRVKDEIKSVLNGRETITEDDLSKMKYLYCVMKESLRLYSVIPGVQRMTTQDTMLGKHKIPANTQIMIAMAIMNKNDDVWDKAMEFNPDRFKDIVYEQSTKHGYFPFAYGTRNCIGSTLALTEAAVVFALMMQKITLEPVEGFRPRYAKFTISLVALNGMKLRVKFDE